MLCRHTSRRRYIHGMGRLPDHFRAVSALARQVPVASVTRPLHPVPLNRLADAFERRLPAERTATCVRHSSMHGR